MSCSVLTGASGRLGASGSTRSSLALFDPLAPENGADSFPSGHAMASTVLYGMLAAFAVQTSTDWRRRVVAVFMAASLIALVCFSRIYLGGQYLSDVLAGIAEGVAWLALCLIAVDMLERHHAGRHWAP